MWEAFCCILLWRDDREGRGVHRCRLARLIHYHDSIEEAATTGDILLECGRIGSNREGAQAVGERCIGGTLDHKAGLVIGVVLPLQGDPVYGVISNCGRGKVRGLRGDRGHSLADTIGIGRRECPVDRFYSVSMVLPAKTVLSM